MCETDGVFIHLLSNLQTCSVAIFSMEYLFLVYTDCFGFTASLLFMAFAL